MELSFLPSCYGRAAPGAQGPCALLLLRPARKRRSNRPALQTPRASLQHVEPALLSNALLLHDAHALSPAPKRQGKITPPHPCHRPRRHKLPSLLRRPRRQLSSHEISPRIPRPAHHPPLPPRYHRTHRPSSALRVTRLPPPETHRRTQSRLPPSCEGSPTHRVHPPALARRRSPRINRPGLRPPQQSLCSLPLNVRPPLLRRPLERGHFQKLQPSLIRACQQPVLHVPQDSTGYVVQPASISTQSAYGPRHDAAAPPHPHPLLHVIKHRTWAGTVAHTVAYGPLLFAPRRRRLCHAALPTRQRPHATRFRHLCDGALQQPPPLRHYHRSLTPSRQAPPAGLVNPAPYHPATLQGADSSQEWVCIGPQRSGMKRACAQRLRELPLFDCVC